VNWISTGYGLDLMDAYRLVAQMADTRRLPANATTGLSYG